MGITQYTTAIGRITPAMKAQRCVEIEHILTHVPGIEYVCVVFRKPDILLVRFAPSRIDSDSIKEILGALGHTAEITEAKR